MIRAVIFDMDGLLIDSEPLWQEAEIKTFREVGVPLTKERTKETMGFRVDEVVEHWFLHYPWKSPSKKDVEAKVVKRVIEFIQEKGKARKGAEKIIRLFAKKKIPMAIASSSQTEIINAVLDKVSIRKYIKVAYSAEHELYGKPHPGVYITAAKKLHVEPESCLAFEDSPNGVLSTKAAKMKCIAVPDATVRNNAVFSIADMVIDSLEDFRLKYLERV